MKPCDAQLNINKTAIEMNKLQKDPELTRIKIRSID